MAYGAGRELWFVNTRFSCLATLDPESSFVRSLAAAVRQRAGAVGRCHLNGLAMVNGQPKYVNRPGRNDTPAAGVRTRRRATS